MISWTIPTAGGLTGLTSQSQSKFSSYSQSGGGVQGDFTISNRTDYSDFLTGQSYTSYLATGSTTYHYSSSSFSSSSISSNNQSAILGTGTNTTATTYTNSTTFSTSEQNSASAITTQTAAAVSIQTSTTSSAGYAFSTTASDAIETLAWTTSSNGSNVEFVLTQTQLSSAVTSYATSTSSFETTTTNGTTNALGAAATVLRANNEIIYHFAPSSTWADFSAATFQAQSTTQITIVPNASMVQLAAITAVDSLSLANPTFISGNTSRSWSFSQSSYSSTYVTTTTTATTATTVNATVLPNETQTASRSTATTTTGSLSALAWQSSTGSHRADDASTSVASLWTTQHTSAGSTWSGTLSWNILRTTTASTTFTRTIPIATDAVSVDYDSYSNSNEGDGITENSSTSWRSESGQTQQANTTAARPPACSTAVGGATSMAAFGPRAARVGTASGGWFSCGAAATFPFSAVLDARPAISTAMPTSFAFVDDSDNPQGVTYYGSNLTFSTQSGSSMTTTSTSLQVAGSSTTTTIAPGVIGLWGGDPGYLETFANGVTVAGVYKDRIGGQTSVLLPGVTTFTDSRTISKMTADTAITPPIGTGGSSETTVYWTVQRNSSALPPVMPANA